MPQRKPSATDFTGYIPSRSLLLCSLLASSLLLGACQSGFMPGESPQARSQREIAAELLRMEVRLGDETDSISNFTVNGFRAINEQSLVVTSGVHEHYLIMLVTPCLELPYAFTVGFQTRTSRITPFDSVIVNSLHNRPERCRIEKIVQLEDLATDEDEAEAGE